MGLYARTLRRLGHHKWMSALGIRLTAADRKVQQKTNGRVALMRWGFQPMLLTTTGRRTGQPRVQPLIYASVDGAFVVAATNFGQAHHPAWSGNLITEPNATVALRGKPEIPVRARLIEQQGEERERLWAAMVRQWPAYDTYAGRAGREIRLFLLTPVNTGAEPAT